MRNARSSIAAIGIFLTPCFIVYNVLLAVPLLLQPILKSTISTPTYEIPSNRRPHQSTNVHGGFHMANKTSRL